MITGPTASGKTDVAFQIARTLQTCIVSADSRQVYIELGVGANKPPSHYLAEVPHYFINHVSVFEEYNAGKYGKECRQVLQHLFLQYDCVVMTGGSPLYIHSALFGLDEIPPVDPQIRRYLKTLLTVEGLDPLVKMLQEKDPDAFTWIDRRNPVRILRALEVTLGTGIPYSRWRKDFFFRGRGEYILFLTPELSVRVRIFCLWRHRSELHERISRRVDQMVFQGLVEEARWWYAFPGLPALRTHGYQEFFPFFAGQYSLQTAVEKVKRNVRRYARRQISWWRGVPGICWLHPDHAVHEILTQVQRFI